MDDKNLAEIEARANAAAPGPWEIEPHSHVEEGCRCLACWATTGWYLRHQVDCEDAALTIPDDQPKPRNPCGSAVLSYEDAEFIAHAREDIPNLLAEVRQLTEDRDRARDAAVALEQENARQAEESARLLTAVADAYGLSPAEVLKDVREAIAAERGEVS